jgi:hypothetical protein
VEAGALGGLLLREIDPIAEHDEVLGKAPFEVGT